VRHDLGMVERIGSWRKRGVGRGAARAEALDYAVALTHRLERRRSPD
jgi:hypothetical protein